MYIDLELDGDSALVMASSSGLGKASATALAREGASVVINGRDERRLEAARAEISEVADGGVVIQRGDLTEKEDIETLVETTVSEFGGLDHLVTSAGGPPSGPFLETTDTVVRDYFWHRVPISAVSRAETPNVRLYSGKESRTTV